MTQSEFRKQLIKEISEEDSVSDIDFSDELHLGCYSYPNCDLFLNGCSHYTNKPEPIGHKD